MIANKVSYSDQETQRERSNRALSREIATEAIVLLENDGILPIQPQRIALYGAGAAMTIRGGSGSGEVIARSEIGIWEGMKECGFAVTTEKWLLDYQEQWKSGKKKFLEDASKEFRGLDANALSNMLSKEYRYPFGREITKEDVASSGTDVCIYVIARQSGEGKDRSIMDYDYSISPQERKNLEFCAQNYDKLIVILNVGAAFDTAFYRQIPGINALVYMSQLGMDGGIAVAQVLAGIRTPSGKLSETWAMDYLDIPFAQEFGIPGEREVDYKEGIYIGYRYFDSFHVTPAYPFGYGLSYTTFEWSDTVATIENRKIKLSTIVKNVGSVSGKEVLQVYVSAPAGTMDKEYQRLVAFVKSSELAPGAQEKLELVFDIKDLASFSERNQAFLLENGDYLVRLGNSSRNTRIVAVLRLAQNLIISRHEHLCKPKKTVTELVPPPYAVEPFDVDVPILHINDSTDLFIENNAHPLEILPDKINQFIAQCSDEELIELVVGTGLLGGDHYFDAPGAVGRTTSALVKRGICNVLLADGPAGLRMQRRSTITKKGKIKPVDASISIYEMLPKFLQKFVYGNPEKDTLIYQFVTGFPVSHALAQTWNENLARQMGEAVSTEMTEYGITYWLAPAINLIRNPLCGRNYEYFSEDPVLTGILAAAVCNGVQSVAGNYVTVKHFACNNQEENRAYVSSNLDERALRELYLKNFEIVIKNAKPAAIMAAYNGINGTFCNNNAELCNLILRKEWNYDGIVMTDWFATADDGRATHWDAIRCGVDMIMPGGKDNKKSLRNALKAGKLSREDLARSASRVLKQIASSQIQKEFFPDTFPD